MGLGQNVLIWTFEAKLVLNPEEKFSHQAIIKEFSFLVCFLRAFLVSIGPFRWATVSAVKIAFSPFWNGRKRVT